MNMHSSRREFLGAAGMTAGAFLAGPRALNALTTPTSRVAIGMCPEYNSQVMDTLAKMFDQMGGLHKLVNNKTVAIKINMTGGPTQKLNDMPVEMTHWTNPTVIGATIALMERLALWARWPAKSSVESWFAGSRPLSRRYSAHLVNCGQYSRAKS